MSGDQDMRIEEAFLKSKRNLLWFCSFAALLFMAKTGTSIEPPLLGRSASIDRTLLAIAIWGGCLYAVIGFYLSSRDVDRNNSQAIYADTVSRIQDRLNFIASQMEEAGKQAAVIVLAVSGDISDRAFELDQMKRHVTEDRFAKVYRHLGSAGNELMLQSENDGRVTYQSAQSHFQAISDALTDEKESLWERLEPYFRSEAAALGKQRLREVAEHAEAIRNSTASLNRQFGRLSDQIRLDHRLRYRWYDKALGFGAFALATGLTLLEIQPWRLSSLTCAWS